MIGSNVQILNSLIFIAEHKGYFRQEGIEAELKTYPSCKGALQALMSGEVDIAAASETPFVCSVVDGCKMAIFATMAYSDNAVGIVARRDRDIEKPMDLRGKTIATVRGSSAHYFLHCFLAEHCMDKNDVKIVFHDPEHVRDALIDGEVDAISIYEPHIYRSGIGLGDNAIFFSSPVLYTKTINLIGKPQEVATPQFSIKVLKALMRAERFMATNPEDVIDIISQKTALPREVVAGVVQEAEFHVVLRQSLLMIMEAQAMWAIEEGLTEVNNVPNFLDALAETPLKSLNEHAVTIIK